MPPLFPLFPLFPDNEFLDFSQSRLQDLKEPTPSMKPNLIQLPSIPEVGFVLFIYLLLLLLFFISGNQQVLNIKFKTLRLGSMENHNCFCFRTQKNEDNKYRFPRLSNLTTETRTHTNSHNVLCSPFFSVTEQITQQTYG